MDSRLKFLPRPTHVITLPGTVEQSGSGHVDRPYVRVEKSRRNVKDAGQPNSECCGVDMQEKLARGVGWMSVP
jgi:hypothetical protein